MSQMRKNEPFECLTSTLAPLPVDDVDTDQIIPASFLKSIDREGLGAGLFAHWRRCPGGEINEEFVLAREEYRAAHVLLAGHNFGCGSSREHAPWALLDYGFRAVVSSGFADIFRANALNNGLLAVELPASTLAELFEAVAANPAAEVTIDLQACTVELPNGQRAAFEMDPFARECLLKGLDRFTYLLEQMPAIETFEARQPRLLDTREGGTWS